MHQKIVFTGLLACSAFLLCSCAQDPVIDVWYGRQQHFGRNGYPQKWINVLGRVTSDDIASLDYSLNGAPSIPLSVGPDGHRLANPGDFNIEIDRACLHIGKNTLEITARNRKGHQDRTKVIVVMHESTGCELSYTIDWSAVERIDDAAQIVDGLWSLTEDGVKVVEPYYDRVIAFGDLSWRDYEVTVPVTFHGMRQPVKGTDGGAGVIHAAIAVNWPGHDEDNHQPHVKWYPLGATAEFRLEPELKNCSWRILGGARKVVEEQSTRPIEYGRTYIMKHRVRTRADSSTHYSVKLWRADEPEPKGWDVQATEGPEDVQEGGALIIAHYTIVTFGDITVNPLEKTEP
jgi:hypothetical protein